MNPTFAGRVRTGPAAHRRTPPPQLTEVAEDVYAYTQAPGGWCVSNAGVLLGPDGAVVIDTLATASRAEELRRAVDTLTPRPARTLVNTHHHGDHTFGNGAFGRGATIVAHDHAHTEMATTGTSLTRLWPDVAWGEVEVVLPTITFADRVTLHLGERRAQVLHVGPAHTTNDVVVWLPEERVLFAGDVVLNGSTPFDLMGSVRGALDAVERLRALGPEVVVCGHGPVGGPELFDETAAYLRWVQGLAADGRAAGLAPLDVARQAASPGPFGHLVDPERTVGNLHRAYAELAHGPLGRPLDVVAVFGEMVEFNDGRLPTCLA